MATFTKLPSGKFRAGARVNGNYRGETFVTKTAAGSLRLTLNYDGPVLFYRVGKAPHIIVYPQII